MDVQTYLQRIGLETTSAADADGVARLQLAHRQAIAFENLDIRLGRTILVDSASVFHKLVARGRGGYCFEQNRLFADVLTALGVENRPLLARVLLGIPEQHTPPRTHVLLLITLNGRPWIADAGFGGTYVPPMPLEHGAEASTTDGARHRLLRVGECGSIGGEWRLERAGPVAATDGRGAMHVGWQPQYVFDLAEVALDDLEMCNHWTSTRPGTRFTSLHIASIVLPGGFAALTERQFTCWREGVSEARSIDDPAEYASVLRPSSALHCQMKRRRPCLCSLPSNEA